MKLIDTSCWTHALRRKGDPQIKSRDADILKASEACWCNIIRLELWRGVQSDWDEELLEMLNGEVKLLAISAEVWNRSISFSRQMRKKGVIVPLPDLIVFSCASVHGMQIVHNDKHFTMMQQLFPPGA